MKSLIQKTIKEIQDVEIQGAFNIAESVVKTVRDYAFELKDCTSGEFKSEIEKTGRQLSNARPNAPMARNAIDLLVNSLNRSKEKSTAKLRELIRIRSSNYLNIMDLAKGIIFEKGQEIISNNDNIFTHCSSSMVEGILSEAKKNAKKFKVYHTETRPLYQGHILARKLLKKNINTTLVTDSAAPFLISEASGKDLMMDKVILGADAIALDGSVINKVGSFGISLAAYAYRIPLYIAAPLLKINENARTNYNISIEQRPAQEIWKNSPEGLKIINFAFDLVPKEFISGIICEFGIISPGRVKKMAQINYPWIFSEKNV